MELLDFKHKKPVAVKKCPPSIKLESHKYKAQVGNKKYTFKTKKDLCTNLNITQMYFIFSSKLL
jgi:hypothetical protein